MLSPTSRCACFAALVFLARLFPIGEKRHGVPAVWLGIDGMYSFAVYAAPPLSCGLSLSKSSRLYRPAKAYRCDMLLRNDK